MATGEGSLTRVSRIYVQASAQAVWDAIAKPEWTDRYASGGRVECDLRPGLRGHDQRGGEARRGGPGTRCAGRGD